MLYGTTLIVNAAPQDVFSAIHEYKLRRRPDQFFSLLFLERLVKMEFRVLTGHTLGLGAIFDWRFSALGVTLLAFQEQIVEWVPDKTVAYQAVSGWSMHFKVDLDGDNSETHVSVQLDISTGNPVVDRLFRPFFEWGLRQAVRNLIAKGLREIRLEDQVTASAS